ncbi:hypothetical protein IGI04_009182 [Brassica rapa subsp. trilocularis]|uniref:Secreted protein n=1 Tax=Brassica rapa subsp. trilocularis TaxID=1813537 RepID=A0ABQ7MXN7_BRACM|nr:hypothetical protein IGI04_009182 [Brassica rapa subsp. trilocularis]
MLVAYSLPLPANIAITATIAGTVIAWQRTSAAPYAVVHMSSSATKARSNAVISSPAGVSTTALAAPDSTATWRYLL